MDVVLIESEAIRIEIEMDSLQCCNSPSGTHYMVKISEEFLRDAGTKDTEVLLDKLRRVKGAYISTFKDIRGLFVIAKDKFTIPVYKHDGMLFGLLRNHKEYSILKRIVPRSPHHEYAVVWRIKRTNRKDLIRNCTWEDERYFNNIEEAVYMYYTMTHKSIKQY